MGTQNLNFVWDFPPPSSPTKNSIVLRLCNSAKPILWVEQTVRGLEQKFFSPSPSPSSSSSPPGGVLSRVKLIALAQQVEEGWGTNVCVKLMRSLRVLTLPSWRELGPSGILFHGPPGTGKSYLATLIMNWASEGPQHILFQGVGALLNERYVGEAEKRLKGLAESASAAPNKLFFIFIDEVHGLAKRQSSGSGRDNSSGSSKQDLLLSLLEVMTRYPNILFLFATNFLASLDPAFLRSKRIDLQILIPSHTFNERKLFYRNKIESMVIPQTLSAHDKSNHLNKADHVHLRESSFATMTTNFSKAQLDSLCDRVQAEFLLGAEDEFWKLGEFTPPSEGEKISPERLLIHVRDVALGGGEQTKLFLHNVISQTFGLDDDFQKWVNRVLPIANKVTTPVNSGRMVMYGPSGVFGIEGAKQSDQLEIFLNSEWKEDERGIATSLHNLVVSLHPLNSVYFINGEFRNKHGEYLDEALNAVYDECVQQQNCLIIVEMDDIVGLVSESVTFSVGESESVAMGETYSSQLTVGLAETWNSSSSLSNAFGLSSSTSKSMTKGTGVVNTIGYTHGRNVGITDGYSEGLSFNQGNTFGISSNLNKSTTWSTNENQGSSSSQSEGSSSGVSLSGVGLGFSSNSSNSVTNSNSYSRGWGKADSFGESSQHSENSSFQKGQNTGKSRSFGEGWNENSNHAEAKSRQQSQTGTKSSGETKTTQFSKGESMGGSVSASKLEGRGTSMSKTKGGNRSQTMTMRMQYPRAAHSIRRLLNRINRTISSDDPYFLLMYRVTEPVRLGGGERKGEMVV